MAAPSDWITLVEAARHPGLGERPFHAGDDRWLGSVGPAPEHQAGRASVRPPWRGPGPRRRTASGPCRGCPARPVRRPRCLSGQGSIRRRSSVACWRSTQVAHIMAVLDVYGRAAGGLLSNGLAFSALFAAIPTTLLVLGLTGLIVSDQTVRIRVSLALVRAFPPLTELIESALDALTRGAGLTSLVATVGVIWTVSQFYGAVDVAFARIFSDTPERDIVRRTARGFIVVALIGALIVAFIVVAGVASALDALAAEQVAARRLPGRTARVGLVHRRARHPDGVDRVPIAPAQGAAVAVGGDPGGHRGVGRRGPQPGVHVPGPAPGRGGRACRVDRVRFRRARLAVVHVPGASSTVPPGSGSATGASRTSRRSDLGSPTAPAEPGVGRE